jgi:hypothetical protein
LEKFDKINHDKITTVPVIILALPSKLEIFVTHPTVIQINDRRSHARTENTE